MPLIDTFLGGEYFMLREIKLLYNDKVFPVKSTSNLHSHTVNEVGIS